jgi:hypothetical protein
LRYPATGRDVCRRRRKLVGDLLGGGNAIAATLSRSHHCKSFRARIRLGGAGRGWRSSAVANPQRRECEQVGEGVRRRQVGVPIDLNATDDHEDPFTRRRTEARK